MEKILENIAEKILALDEASLTALWKKYRTKMESFSPAKEWERSVIIFFIINSVRVKNQIFNDQIVKQQQQPDEQKKSSAKKPYLKRIK